MPAGPPNDASKASPRVTLPNSWWRFLFADVRSGMHFFSASELIQLSVVPEMLKTLTFLLDFMENIEKTKANHHFCNSFWGREWQPRPEA